MLVEALQFFRDEIRPNAYAIDHDPKAMLIAFDGLKQRGYLALKRAEEFGGPALNEADFRRFQEEVARNSGALAFLQTQHQSAVSMIGKYGGDALKKAYLPYMHDTKTVGLGFSQLRRSGNPICRATLVDGGFKIDGFVPWKGLFQ
jgi:alkylation response protein AidB-like acyl-CoA dehydrogenase